MSLAPSGRRFSCLHLTALPLLALGAAVFMPSPVLAQQAESSPQQAESSPQAAAQPLPKFSMAQLAQRPLLWPEEITTTQRMSDGRNVTEAGTKLKVYSIQADAVVVFDKPDSLTALPANWTDLDQRVATLTARMPEDVRDLPYEKLVDRTDLLPDTLELVTEVTVANGKVYPAGSRLVPGRMEYLRGTPQMTVIDPDAKANDYGQYDRMLFTFDTTDLTRRMQKIALKPPTERKVRDNADFTGKLIDLQGNPLPAPADDAKPRYYVLYYTANWCGWCKKFDPAFISFVNDYASKHPEIQVVYLPSDRTAEEMQTHRAALGLNIPAVDIARRDQLIGLIGQAGPGTPHVMVLTADGRTLHNGAPNGANGANAAIAALKRDIQRTSSAQ